MKKIKFGDVIFTLPYKFTTTPHGFVSYLINRVTNGPTHVMIKAWGDKVFHMDWPHSKLESLETALTKRKIVKVVSPKYSILQKIKLFWALYHMKNARVEYRLLELVMILAYLKIPSIRKRMPGLGSQVCSTFTVSVLNKAGLSLKNCITPKQLLRRIS